MKIEDIFTEICNLKLIDLSNLILMLEKKFSIGKTNINNNINKSNIINNKIELVSYQNKLLTIKTIKNFLGCDLKTAKLYTDNLPKVISLDLNLEKNNELFNELKKINCVVKKI